MSGAQAQSPGWGAAPVATFSDDRSAAGGLAEVVVHPYDRVRLVAVVAGLADLSGGASPIGRGEALAQFHVTPYQLTGWGVYAAGGLAYQVQEGERGAARLVVALGAERSPGKPRSMFFEVGLGGGWRIAAGLRVRPRGGR